MAIDKKSFTKTKLQNIKLHKDGTTFWFDFTISGKRYSRIWKGNPTHTKADRLKIAQRQLDTIRDEITRTQDITADTNATINDYWIKLKALKNWKVDLEKRYNYYFDKHLKKISNLKIKDVKPAHFTSLNATLSHLAPRTRRTAYEILNPIFNLAIEDEIILKSPIKKSHIPVRKQLEEKKVITDAVTKFRKVHSAIHSVFSDNPHHRALFLFGFYGRRLRETTQLQWDDIDFNNNTYRVKGLTSKVNVDMTFSLPQDIRIALLEFKDSTDNIFNVKIIDRHYKKIRIVTGIEEFSFHWMRNLAVSALSSMGADVTHLSAMLGHNDAGTLKKYLSLQRETSTAVTNDMVQKLLLGTN